MEAMRNRLEDRMEAGFDKVDRRFEGIDARFEALHLMSIARWSESGCS
jgi:hypothetical protein